MTEMVINLWVECSLIPTIDSSIHFCDEDTGPLETSQAVCFINFHLSDYAPILFILIRGISALLNSYVANNKSANI